MSKCRNCGLESVESPLCSICCNEYENMKGIMEEHEKKTIRKGIINIPPKQKRETELKGIDDVGVEQTEG